jgi:hypothetical protein
MRWPGGPTSRPAAFANEVEEVHMPKQPLPKPPTGPHPVKSPKAVIGHLGGKK